MVLIEYQAPGRTPRRCDARCYTAHGPDCQCICGSKNHGKGLQDALEITLSTFKNLNLQLLLPINLDIDS